VLRSGTNCARACTNRGFRAFSRHVVTLSKVWWWAQNWTHFQATFERLNLIGSTLRACDYGRPQPSGSPPNHCLIYRGPPGAPPRRRAYSDCGCHTGHRKKHHKAALYPLLGIPWVGESLPDSERDWLRRGARHNSRIQAFVNSWRWKKS
jgi:hypothetical protein